MGANRETGPGTGPLPVVADPHNPGDVVRLTRHSSGQWAKKHAGKRYYFGSDPREAVAEYIRRWPAIIGGRDAQHVYGPHTLKSALESYLDDLEAKLGRGERSWTTARDHRRICKLIAEHFGGRTQIDRIPPSEWSLCLHELWGGTTPVTRHANTAKVRAILRWCETNLGCRPQIGSAMAPVPARSRRTHLRSLPSQLLSPGQARRLIKQSRREKDATMEASLWLALNGGMYQSEVSALTAGDLVEVDGRSWVQSLRPKTGSPRMFPLWPESVAAISSAGGLPLLTRAGTPLWKPGDDRLEKRLRSMKSRTWSEESRHRSITWRWFRKTHITVAKSAPISVPHLADTVRRVIAGHTTSDVNESYVQSLPREPFIETVEWVRGWLLRT